MFISAHSANEHQHSGCFGFCESVCEKNVTEKIYYGLSINYISGSQFYPRKRLTILQGLYQGLAILLLKK